MVPDPSTPPDRDTGPDATGDTVTDARLDATAYLDRLGVAPEAVETPTRDALATLQRAHVTTVPFENLS